MLSGWVRPEVTVGDIAAMMGVLIGFAGLWMRTSKIAELHETIRRQQEIQAMLVHDFKLVTRKLEEMTNERDRKQKTD